LFSHFCHSLSEDNLESIETLNAEFGIYRIEGGNMKPVKTVEKVSLVCSWLVLTVFVLANPVLAQVELKSVIPIPGFVDFSNPASLHAASFDIGWVSRGKYYFTDRGPTPLAFSHPSKLWPQWTSY
jgi:hypothetical protein